MESTRDRNGPPKQRKCAVTKRLLRAAEGSQVVGLRGPQSRLSERPSRDWASREGDLPICDTC